MAPVLSAASGRFTPYKEALRRLRAERSGFTLVELLVVLIIVGVLLAIAFPAYISYKNRAERRVAAANVRSAIPAVEAYYADNKSYTGMTIAALQAQVDQAINLNQDPTILGDGDGYCIQSDSNGRASGGSTPYRYVGPGVEAAPVDGTCT